MSEQSDPSVIISLTVPDTSEALRFYEEAFDAKELFRMAMPDGKVGHAEFKIGNTMLMMSCEFPDWNAYALEEGQMAPSLFVIPVEDCDKAFQQAIEAGATEIQGPTDQPWGVRTGIVLDPFGFRWNVRHVIEQLTHEEIVERFKTEID